VNPSHLLTSPICFAFPVPLTIDDAEDSELRGAIAAARAHPKASNVRVQAMR
jgi:hypothetical protein